MDSTSSSSSATSRKAILSTPATSRAALSSSSKSLCSTWHPVPHHSRGSADDLPAIIPSIRAEYRGWWFPEMSLVVQKFGGSSLKNPERIQAVAERVAVAARQQPLVVVVSAMGEATDHLIDLARR